MIILLLTLLCLSEAQINRYDYCNNGTSVCTVDFSMYSPAECIACGNSMNQCCLDSNFKISATWFHPGYVGPYGCGNIGKACPEGFFCPGSKSETNWQAPLCKCPDGTTSAVHSSALSDCTPTPAPPTPEPPTPAPPTPAPSQTAEPTPAPVEQTMAPTAQDPTGNGSTIQDDEVMSDGVTIKVSVVMLVATTISCLFSN